jgi:hypothetical protein
MEKLLREKGSGTPSTRAYRTLEVPVAFVVKELMPEQKPTAMETIHSRPVAENF